MIGRTIGKTSVVDHPSLDRTMLLHCRKNLFAHFHQQFFVTPGTIGYQMMQRLMHPPHIVGTEAGCHRKRQQPDPGSAIAA